jgi:hypothetical protein
MEIGAGRAWLRPTPKPNGTNNKEKNSEQQQQ